MSNPGRASEQLKWFLQRLDEVPPLIEFLDKFGSIENAFQERERALADLTKQQDEARQVLEGLQREAAAMKKEIAASRQAANEKNDRLLADGRSKVEKMIAEAEQRAAGIVAAAERLKGDAEVRANNLRVAISALAAPH